MRIARRLLGIFLATIIAAELVLQVGHGIILLWRHQRWQGEARQTKSGELVVLCVGESTTEWGGENAYPRLLQSYIQARLPQSTVRVVNGGRAAFDSKRLHELLPGFIAESKPNFVVFMMGINDPLYLPITDSLEKSEFTLKFFSWLRLAHLFEFLRARASLKNQDVATSAENRKLHTFPYRPGTPASIQQERYFQAGEKALQAGHWALAKHFFSQYLNGNANAYDFFRVGNSFYWRDGLGKFRDEAARYLERSYALDPHLPETQWLLGAHIAAQPGKEARAEQILISAIAERNVNADLFGSLADVYLRQNRIVAAREVLEKGLRTGRGDTRFFLYTRLLGICERMQPFSRELCGTWWREALTEFPGNLKLLSYSPDPAQANQSRWHLLNDVRNYAFHPGTNLHYRSMVEEALRDGATVIAMQYPTLELSPLKDMLEGIPGLYFLENRSMFMAALSKEPYSAIFSDNFAGSFGHTTTKGSLLLATNLGDEILRLWRR